MTGPRPGGVVDRTRGVLGPKLRQARRGLPASRRMWPVITGVVGLALLLLFVVWWGPSALTRHPKVEGADRHTAINGARTGLVALVAALGGGAGLLYTARTYRLSHRGQIADRYTKALDQLSSDSSSVRTGALYALDRIAEDNPREYVEIVVDVLAAYVRDRAPWPPARATRAQGGAGRVVPQGLPSRDVEIAVSILLPLVKLAQRKNLDLSNSNLASVNFQEARLLDARFLGSNLSGAKFNGACLAGANLTGATVDEKTSFVQADLYKAFGLEHVDRQFFEHAAVVPWAAPDTVT